MYFYDLCLERTKDAVGKTIRLGCMENQSTTGSEPGKDTTGKNGVFRQQAVSLLLENLFARVFEYLSCEGVS